jgi:hypothetical protein
MIFRHSNCRLLVAVLALAVLLCGSAPAYAQATISVDAGLDGYFKPQRWMPVQVTLTNQGAPVRAEVRVRFTNNFEGSTQEHRIPTRDLPSGARQRHTLYIDAPFSYHAQALQADLLREGRLLNSVNPTAYSIVGEGEWLALAITRGDSTLKQLTVVNLPPGRMAPLTGMSSRMQGQQTRAHVAVLPPDRVPDRWHGLDAADMIVLGDVTERDFTPEQLSALQQYAYSGGTLVITGGANWNRLTTPFFEELLPVKVNGAAQAVGPPSTAVGGAKYEFPSGAFPACTAAPLPGTRVYVAASPEIPLIAAAHRGSGRVVYLAFDPALPPFRQWEGTGRLWREILMNECAPPEVRQIAMAEKAESRLKYGYASSTDAMLTNAPYAISRLDIPAFYLVALFLLAYILCLVPLNYQLLKSRDRKEYAWLTTPIIAGIFCLGAYGIGYGMKGGRTLMFSAAVVQSYAGQPAGYLLNYTGVFSPRKARYRVELSPAAAEKTLLAETRDSRAEVVLRDASQSLDNLAVDMWAMRVLRAEGVTDLGQGVTLTGTTLRNGTPYHLDDCFLLQGNQVIRVGDIAPGAEAEADPAAALQSTRSQALPPQLDDEFAGAREAKRIKRAVYRGIARRMGALTGEMPTLVAWVREPLADLHVNRKRPPHEGAQLLLVHLYDQLDVPPPTIAISSPYY